MPDLPISRIFMDRIRIICLVLILLLWCGNLWAHTTEKIERVEFVFEAKDGRGAEIYNDSGTLLLHASRFRMEMADDLLMVSDGKTIWIYRPQTEDVIIMDADIANLQSASDDDISLEQTLHTLAGLFGYSHSNSSEIKIERSTNGTL